MKKKIAFITGITGQDGSYLAELLLSKGFENFEYDPLKHKLKSLEGKFISKSTSLYSSNILYLRNIVEIQRRISRKNSFTLGTGKKI